MILETHLRPTSSSTHKQRTGDIQVATLLANARLLRQNGEISLALNLLREASNRDSKNPIVLSVLAEALEQAGKISEALIARKALNQLQCSVSSVFGFAQTLYRMGRDEDALQSYYEVLSLIAETEVSLLFEVHKNIGNIYVRKGDFDGAEESYNKAYAIQPKSDVLMVNYGTLEVQRGDLSRARECFRTAVELNPGNDRAWAGLAMVHQQFGDFELAWGNLERALDLNPSNRTAIHLAAHWAMRDKTPSRAIERMESYLAFADFDEEMSLVLINLFCASGRLDLASLETGRVLAWNPSHQEVQQLQRRLLEGQA